MDGTEFSRLRERLRVAEQLRSNIDWLEKLRDELRNDKTQISVFRSNDCSATIRLDDSRQNVLDDLKAAMIEAVSSRIGETNRLFQQM